MTTELTEELLYMVHMSGTMTGNYLYLCTEKSLENAHADWLKLVSYRAPAMICVNIELVTKLQLKKKNVQQ